jgi:hypothetical protein
MFLGAARAATDNPSDAAVFVPLLNETLENERTGRDVPWSNPATARSGVIRVERTFYRCQQPCREYLRTITTLGGSNLAEARGTGCRVAKAKWDLQEGVPAESSAGSVGSTGSSGAAGGDPGLPARSEDPARSAPPAKPGADPPQRLVRKPPPLVFSLPTRSDL